MSRKESTSFSFSPEEKSLRRPEVKSENQSLLGAVEPLDWLFSADSEPEPPSSPKLVNVSFCERFIQSVCKNFHGPVVRRDDKIHFDFLESCKKIEFLNAFGPE